VRSAGIGPKTGPKNRWRATGATPPDARKPAPQPGSPSGASRTRTGGLLGAIHDASELNVPNLQGVWRSGIRSGVAKLIRNLRDFSGVLPRGTLHVAKLGRGRNAAPNSWDVLSALCGCAPDTGQEAYGRGKEDS